MSNATKFASLTKANYKYWCVQVRDHLRANDLWDIVEEDGGQAENRSTDTRALEVIRNACETDALNYVNTCETAKEAWNIIYNIYSDELKFDTNSLKEKFENDVDRLHNAIMKRKSNPESELIGSGEDYLICKISESTGLTAIHVAIEAENCKAIETLVSKDRRSLYAKDLKGYTPLAFVANLLYEEMKIAKWLLSKTKGVLLNIRIASSDQEKLGDLPVILAAAKGHKKLTPYLFFRMNLKHLFMNKCYDADKLLSLCIHAEIFDVAAALLQYTPDRQLIGIKSEMDLTYETNSCEKPILELVNKPDVFYGGARYDMFMKFLYKVLIVPREIKKEGKIIIIKRSRDGGANPNVVVGGIYKLLNAFTRLLIFLFPGIERIYEKKMNHHLAIEILKCFCERVKKIDSPLKLHSMSVQDAMLKASEEGIWQFVELMGKANPDLWYVTDVNQRGVFAHAILNHRRKVFDLIYQIEGGKNLVTAIDSYGNNLLHLAAELSHSPPCKTLRHMQWFEEMEAILPPILRNAKNSRGAKPSELFAKNQAAIVKEGIEWIKKLVIGLCIVSLIVSTTTTFIAFGMQILPFSYFSTFGISFITASTSVMLFVEMIETCYYNDVVFTRSAPRKLAYSQINLMIALVLLISAVVYDIRPQLEGHLAILIVYIFVSIIHTAVFVIMFRPYERFRVLSRFRRTLL